MICAWSPRSIGFVAITELVICYLLECEHTNLHIALYIVTGISAFIISTSLLILISRLRQFLCHIFCLNRALSIDITLRFLQIVNFYNIMNRALFGLFLAASPGPALSVALALYL